MNKKTKLMAAISGIVLASATGVGAWWFMAKPAAAQGTEPKKTEESKTPAKYVTVDKVIVMLRRSPGDTEPHYLAADLVLATTEDKERHAKEHLPLLRSIAVRALSGYTMPVASNMTVEQYADHLNKTFNASYAKERMEKPFSEVMIGKLIIE